MTVFTCSKCGEKYGLMSNLYSHYDEEHRGATQRKTKPVAQT